MEHADGILAIQSVGDGTGQVEPAEIEAGDITVSVSQSFGSLDRRGNRPERMNCLDEDTIEEHVAVYEPDDVVSDQYDAVISVAGAPLPGMSSKQDGSDISIEITVDQVRQAKAAQCPGCENDLRETFEDGGCTKCGFYYDGDHLDDERQARLNRLQEEYDG